MANYCAFDMTVTGRRDNVDEFVRILNYQEKSGLCFSRIFEAEPQLNVWEYGLLKTVQILGECAWSVYCCMLSGPYSYYYDYIHGNEKTAPSYEYNGRTYHPTNILAESRRLSLQIEVYSTEPGMCFCEQLKIVNGIMVVNNCGEYQCVYYSDDYSSYEDFAKDYGFDPTNEEQCVAQTGFSIKEMQTAFANKTSLERANYHWHGWFEQPTRHLMKDIMYRLIN